MDAAGQKIREFWNRIYRNEEGKLEELMAFLEGEKKNRTGEKESDPHWYNNAVIYSLYVDHFAGNFDKMAEKLDYLKEIGVNTLWLLPILDSPMGDQGFDIRDYYKVRDDLGGNESFFTFVEKAHEHGIRILFDLAVNHTSSENEWFKSARKDKNSKYRDYYIWNDNKEKYSGARLLFKGMVDSNWEYNEETKDYFFHRFYGFQPDLNYANPDVLVEMIRVLAFWKGKGVDGLRMDAIPFIWKEEGTGCENLENTHNLVKLFRNALDYIEEGTLLIAEANMEPNDVVQYFGDGDECQAAYHFPLMPKLFLSVAEKDSSYIINALKPEFTPAIPENCRWVSFLRCHDELTLEFVTREERDLMNKHYLIHEELGFRENEGIAGRLYNLLSDDPQKVLLMYSLLFSVEGSPIIYYGDEVGMENDRGFYEKSSKMTGYKDSRFFNRGPMNWKRAESAVENKMSDEGVILNGLKELLKIRSSYQLFFNNKAEFGQGENKKILEVIRTVNGKTIRIYNNLSDNAEKVSICGKNLTAGGIKIEGETEIKAHGYLWIME